MKLQASLVHSPLSTKLISLFGFILMVVYFIYAIIMGQTNLIYIWLAVLLLTMLLVRTASPVFSYATKLLLLSLYIYASIQVCIMLLRSQDFIIVMLFVALFLPILFTQPKIAFYIFLASLFFFTQSGVLAHRAEFNFYSRGEGMLPFNISLVEVFLYLIAVFIVLRKIIQGTKFTSRSDLIPCNLYKYFLAFNILFMFYIVWGIGTGVPPSNIFHRRGVINITNMSIFVFVMLNIFRTEKDIESLKNFLMTFIGLKAVWVFLRFLFLGGDPLNPYAVLTVGGKPYGIDTVTVFDMAEHLIYSVGLFYSLWSIFFNVELSKKKKFFYIIVAIFFLLDIVFSYRRAAWAGLVMVATWLVIALPAAKRFFIGIPVFVLCAILLASVVSKRSLGGSGGGILQTIAPDVLSEQTGEVSKEEGRFRELTMAWMSIRKNPLLGLGPWGKYTRVKLSEQDLWLPTDLVHSAIVHMLLKTGLIGVLLFISFFYKYFQFWLTRRKELPLEIRGFAEASFAGALFLIPQHLFAPSIIEFRTMILSGFCFAIPYMVHHLYKRRCEV